MGIINDCVGDLFNRLWWQPTNALNMRDMTDTKNAGWLFGLVTSMIVVFFVQVYMWYHVVTSSNWSCFSYMLGWMTSGVGWVRRLGWVDPGGIPRHQDLPEVEDLCVYDFDRGNCSSALVTVEGPWLVVGTHHPVNQSVSVGKLRDSTVTHRKMMS